MRSATPRKASLNISIISAVIPLASSPEKTSKISAQAVSKFPLISAISLVTSKIDTILFLMYSLLFSRYLSTPPIKLSAIVIPIRVIEPVLFPKASMIASAHLLADAVTEGSEKISFRFFLMLLMLLIIDSIFFSEFPNPILNPFLNIAASSLHRFSRPDSFLSVLSISVFPVALSPEEESDSF